MRFSWLLYCFLLIVILSAVTEGLKIQSISVPDSVNGNSSEPLRLDCVFELNDANERQNLVVQWSLNDMLIYQWSTKRKPFVNESMKHGILEEQRTITNNRLMNMPLTILNSTIDLTGWYECQVNAITSEDRKQKYVHVYVPADNLDLKKEEDNEALNLTCTAEGLYPEPVVSLMANNLKLQNASQYIIRSREQLYDVSATFTIYLDQLKQHTIFNCSLIMPEVNLTYYKVLTFSKSGQDGVSKSPSFEQTSQGNGAGLSRARYNINLMLILQLALWSFTSAINRVSVELVKS